jgi:hypothetical protein
VKQKKDPSAIEFIEAIIKEHNVESSFGTLVLKNGVLVKVRKYYDYFREMWNEYKYLDSIGTKDEMEEFIKNKTVGLVISNGEIDIFIPDIMATVSEGEMIKNMKQENGIEEED